MIVSREPGCVSDGDPQPYASAPSVTDREKSGFRGGHIGAVFAGHTFPRNPKWIDHRIDGTRPDHVAVDSAR
jgi:hypothetical protein